MSYIYRLVTVTREENPTPRCTLRPLAKGYGYCSAARSCAECPLAKMHADSQFKIEQGDTVQVGMNAQGTVERFDQRNGYDTGYVWINSRKGLIRERLSFITLKSKNQATAVIA